MEPSFRLTDLPDRLAADQAALAMQWRRLAKALTERGQRIASHYSEKNIAFASQWASLAKSLAEVPPHEQPHQYAAYALDAMQRSVLTFDALRRRSAIDRAHEEAGTPSVLAYQSEEIVDGATLPRPVNYKLLRIVPPDGVAVHAWKRPYMIIDPRAGHGAGIGGFKPDSQVGVALRDGHPVYFVAFDPWPEPSQTLADVTGAEAAFVAAIAARHPQAPKPIIVGNCQGGWAAMILAAAHPDITGPLVINGAPLSTWSGQIGADSMRYAGGMLGGLPLTLFLVDVGAGILDGAHLVGNFEQLNPGRNWWRKYYDLFASIDDGADRFLEFERWWGGFHYMSEAEIRWIVEQLFIGNRLARGEARLEHGRILDLKRICSPIIVFASRGDNITPPEQALNWILDTYADENEIKIRGQRIVYMLHEKVGHLGIFVSSSVAKKEHTEVASTMKTIETLAPGLYEMVIDSQEGDGIDARFFVSFHGRRFEDLRALSADDRSEEEAFAAVARLSELGTELYDLTVRPAVQTLGTPSAAAALRSLHPMRLQRRWPWNVDMFSSWLGQAAAIVAANRTPVSEPNVFKNAEQIWADAVENGLNFYRDLKDSAQETMFLGWYETPWMKWVGRTHNFQRTRKQPEELRLLPEVQSLLLNIDRGGFAEAVVRMLILLASARGEVRRSRLERSAKVLSSDEPFASLGSQRRAALIHEQTVIVEFEPSRAVEALPALLKAKDERTQAIAVVEYIAGPLNEMEPHSLRMLSRFREVLGLAPLDLFPVEDPLTPVDKELHETQTAAD
jgi:pimeloyl-ACP methyl ester carboxylesterase/tellurite resistance protein